MLLFKRAKGREYDPYKLASPQIYLWRMTIFLIIAAFIAVLYRQVIDAFEANPGLNAVIIAVLAIGIALAFRQILRLFPEISWVNTFRVAEPGIEVERPPVLLAPMATLLGDRSAAWRSRRHDACLLTRSRCGSTRTASSPLPHEPSDLPRTARHLLGPAADGGAVATTIQSLDVAGNSTGVSSSS